MLSETLIRVLKFINPISVINFYIWDSRIDFRNTSRPTKIASVANER